MHCARFEAYVGKGGKLERFLLFVTENCHLSPLPTKLNHHHHPLSLKVIIYFSPSLRPCMVQIAPFLRPQWRPPPAAAAAAGGGGLSWETMMVFYSLERAEKKAAFPKPGCECREAEGCKKALRETSVEQQIRGRKRTQKNYRLLDKCTQTDNLKAAAAAVVTVQYGINGEGLHGLMMRKALTPQTPDQQVLPPPPPPEREDSVARTPTDTHTHTKVK